MPRQKVTFTNNLGIELAGSLETPKAETPIRSYALFAHCFTCGKDIAAASRVARALTKHNIAVLRFDFTGLGNSDGDFANTDFSSNIEDLVAAYEMLERDFGRLQDCRARMECEATDEAVHFLQNGNQRMAVPESEYAVAEMLR